MSRNCYVCGQEEKYSHNANCPYGRIAELEQSIALMKSQRNAAIETEKKDASRALHALAAAHYPTPAGTYGFNSSWAISDLCRAVRQFSDERNSLRNALDAIVKCGALNDVLWTAWRVEADRALGKPTA